MGVRPASRAPLKSVSSARLDVAQGLCGDHYSKTGGNRQVTLIQYEHLPVIASLCGHTEVQPEMLRRNLVISGINLLALKDQRFYIGETLLEGTGLCHPCSRMEQNLGKGGHHAMRGHGGITARVLQAGEISLGDSVRLVPEDQLSLPLGSSE
ncbi:MAG: MOSC domain-containing protein [Gammaproteobacteria bacterium]